METFQNQIDPISFLSLCCWFVGRIGKPYFCLKNLSWGWKMGGRRKPAEGMFGGRQHLHPEWLLSHIPGYVWREKRGREPFCSEPLFSTRVFSQMHGNMHWYGQAPRPKEQTDLIWCLLLVEGHRTTKNSEKDKGQAWNSRPSQAHLKRVCHLTFSRGWDRWILSSRPACTT